MKLRASPSKWLLPLVPAYRLALWLRARRLGSRAEPFQRLRFPVVSIGNLSTGGTGKTPLTIALAKALGEHGFYVDVLSRGYGRQGEGAIRVAGLGTAEQFGDEPLLIAQQTGLPVYVAGQRYSAGMLAEADAVVMATLGETHKRVVHLLDDGFQHRQLVRDVDILLLDRQDWGDRLLPAGNLREPLEGAKRAGAIAIPAEDAGLDSELRTWGWTGPIWRIRRTMEMPPVPGPVAAFCGIARPAQFFAGLEDGGMQVVLRKAFQDHHVYSSAEMERLDAEARAAGAVALVTTAKDRVRLGELGAKISSQLPLLTAGLRVEIENHEEALNWLLGRLGVTAA